MLHNIPVLQSKLRPVSCKKTSFPRPRLFKRLSESLEGRVTLILSPPGGGKSTLAHHFLVENSIEFLWYEMDAVDADPVVFLNHLLFGLRRNFPEFLPQITTIEYSHIKDNSFRHCLGTLFITQLELHVRERVVIVLDNYERIKNAVEVRDYLHFFLEHLPENVHLFLLSTRRPNLSLSRLSLLGQVEILDGQELAFQPNETKEFFSMCLERLPSRKLLEKIQQRTEGWATGLMIYLRSLQELGQQHFTSRQLSSLFEAAVYEYFDENILSNQEDSIKNFLLKTSLLNTLTPAICNRFLKIDEADRILLHLVENNLFTSANKGERNAYQYSPLFRSFLKDTLRRSLPKHEVEMLHNRLAVILKKYDQSEAAFHFIHARNYSKAKSILRNLGMELIENNQVDTLDRLLKMLPSHMIKKDPYLTYYEARLLEDQGDFERSFEAYKQAMEMFEHQNRVPEEVACCDRLGLVNIRRDDYKRARDFFQNGINLLENQNIQENISHRLISEYTRLSQVLVKLEEEKKSFHYVQKAEELYAYYRDPRDRVTLDQCHALRYVVMGDLKNSILYASAAASLARDFGLHPKIPVLYHYLSFCLLYLGNLKESFRYAREGLEYAENYGIEDNITGITGMLLTDMAYGHSVVGDYDQAINTFIKSITQLNKAHNLTCMFWDYHGLYTTYLKMNDLESSIRYLELLSDVARKINFPIEMAMAKVDRAYLCSMKREFDQVEKLIKEAEVFLNYSCKKMSVSLANLLAAKSLLNIGRKGWAEKLVISSLKPVGDNIYHYLIYQERDWLVPFLYEILPRHEELETVLQEYQSIAASFSVSNKEEVEVVPKITSVSQKQRLMDMRIYCLGSFRVFVENEEVFLDRSRSKKAVRLLKYLFHKRNQGYTPRDFFMETLWPEVDPEKSYPNFRVVLSMLRKILIPRGKGVQHFPNILAKSDGLCLSLGENGWADVDEFLSEIKLAELKGNNNPKDALEHYLKAERLYRGDYFVEDVYEDLFLIDREYYKNQYIKVLTKILDTYERQGNTFEAINYAYEILNLDRYSEEVYRKLMRFYAGMGKKKEVDTVYQICRKSIEEELGVNLSFETRELYERIRQV